MLATLDERVTTLEALNVTLEVDPILWTGIEAC